jgi:hypothetical protein
MAGSSFTFRCGECNRLLGVSRSRIGATVTCPKCGTELIVPEPEDEPTPGAGAAPGDPTVSASGEPVLAGTPSPAVQTTTGGAADPGFPVVAVETEPFSLRPSEPSRPYRVPDRSRPAPTGSQPPATEPFAPLVRTEPEPIRSLGVTTGSTELRPLSPRAGDVLLPRTAFLLWPFVMLVALVFAFAAGLLAGHVLWHSPATPPAASNVAAPG